MTFNPFDKIPEYPWNSSASKRNNLRDNAEYTDFEDVTEGDTDTHNKKIDKEARGAQIAKAASEVVDKTVKGDPFMGLLVVGMFSLGAEWTDEHPISNYNSRKEWISAMFKHQQKIISDNCPPGDRNLLLEMAIAATFLRGAKWAENNPALPQETPSSTPQ